MKNARGTNYMAPIFSQYGNCVWFTKMVSLTLIEKLISFDSSSYVLAASYPNRSAKTTHSFTRISHIDYKSFTKNELR